jgi:hypothetical protein
MLINVRDPVDRFVSAFQWAMKKSKLRRCMHWVKLTDAERAGKTAPGGCVRMTMHESLMINGNYGGDANQLAEALCVHGDTKTQQQAHIDVRAIMHMDSLEDWFGGAAMFKDLSLNRNFTIVAVPLEPGFDFDHQIENALQYIASKSVLSSSKTPKAKPIADSPKRRHSSLSADEKKQVLSAAGSCCVAKLYRSDYTVVIPALAEVGCHGEHTAAAKCTQALHSMLARRTDALNSKCNALL